ncbi:hypothetical protein Pmani_025898 [Petrolisthes manimaculis]|uniref:Uncharacterized protein n=1 Tax=Petrolisthes manimaculis TaxID=1843537 RepID=A0AAE1U0N9_9EUCA|nr:hypothetical protein Pmani_025898 [Petrolisthes manimaculis]
MKTGRNTQPHHSHIITRQEGLYYDPTRPTPTPHQSRVRSENKDSATQHDSFQNHSQSRENQIKTGTFCHSTRPHSNNTRAKEGDIVRLNTSSSNVTVPP